MFEARIDLHAHTCHSEDREKVALPQGFSVTFPFHPTHTPVECYEAALERGMTHVTFTDHDTIDGCLDLLERHADTSRFITGEEVTCYHYDLPVHIGVYGLTEDDHRLIHDSADSGEPERRCLRWNLPALTDYLRSRRLPYDLKHPVWCRNGKTHTREQLIELFGYFELFEAVNGTRHRRLNELGTRLALLLIGSNAAFTAGSDSHTTEIGTVYTRTVGQTTAEVLESLRRGNVQPVGEHGSHHLLDSDIRACIDHNAVRHAGQLLGLADGLFRQVPVLAREVCSLTMSGAVAFGVVQEFSRQRALARTIADMFAGELAERGSNHVEATAEFDAGRVVHRHLRRD